MADGFQPTLSSPTIEQIRHFATLIVEQCGKEVEDMNTFESTLRTIEIAADKILDRLPEGNR
jgi:hypothetical protein